MQKSDDWTEVISKEKGWDEKEGPKKRIIIGELK